MSQKNLAEEIIALAESNTFDKSVSEDFLRRLKEGQLTRDENTQTHFCVYFLPFDEKTKKVFIVHHKKAQQWLSPGGHIDKDENIFQTLNREIEEELGVSQFFSTPPQPFLLTTVDINQVGHPCKKHYDIWFLVPTDGTEFHVDPAEFLETRWMDKKEALSLITDRANILAINKIL